MTILFIDTNSLNALIASGQLDAFVRAAESQGVEMVRRVSLLQYSECENVMNKSAV